MRRLVWAVLLPTVACTVAPNPTATFTAEPVPSDPLVVQFDASKSVAGAGTIKNYAWNFGHGAPVETGQAIYFYRYPAKAYYAVTLEVTDGNLGKATADPMLVLAGNLRPEATLIVPGEVYLGARVTLDGSRSIDRDGQVKRWEFTLNGASISSGPDSSTTYLFEVAGPAKAALRVLDDDDQACTRDDERTITVLPTRAPDREPPRVEIAAPADDEPVGNGVVVKARVEDDNAVADVEFLADGAVFFRDREQPYEGVWDSTRVLNGPHTITVRAFDTANNSNSRTITVLVRNP